MASLHRLFRQILPPELNGPRSVSVHFAYNNRLAPLRLDVCLLQYFTYCGRRQSRWKSARLCFCLLRFVFYSFTGRVYSPLTHAEEGLKLFDYLNFCQPKSRFGSAGWRIFRLCDDLFGRAGRGKVRCRCMPYVAYGTMYLGFPVTRPLPVYAFSPSVSFRQWQMVFAAPDKTMYF